MYSQERFAALFALVLLHLQQPAVAPLPQEGGGIWIFTALAAHVQLNIRGADGAAELCGKTRLFAELNHHNTAHLFKSALNLGC